MSNATHEPKPADASDETEPVSVEQALEYAVQLHRSGKPDLAEIIYQRILAIAPENADALHFYGLLHHQLGRTNEGLQLIFEAIRIQPDNEGMLSNLGNIYAQQNRHDEAAQAYQAAIVVEPGHVDAYCNLGVALRKLERPEEAEAAYRTAIALNPNHRESHDNLGRLLSGTGRVDEAIACHVRALELEPRNADTRRLLVATYAATDRRTEALALVRNWLEDEPDNPTARHLLAAISGENVPDRAADRYIETMFDAFAPSFDAKLKKLGYRAPELVADVLTRSLGAGSATLTILDAGCGTGLCGPLVRQHAAKLVGVDLSPKMIGSARERDTYDELVVAELAAYLADHPGAFDIVISADTLCYFGELRAVVAAAAHALRPGGLVVFTVEKDDGSDGFRINPHGRFSHTIAHVTAALAAAGLRETSVEEAVLRMERGRPVDGLLASGRAPDGESSGRPSG